MKQRLTLSESDYECIIYLIVKKFSYDEMILSQVTSREEEILLEKRLYEAEVLFEKLEKQPRHMSENTAKEVISFLKETEKAYKGAFTFLQTLGDTSTEEFAKELKIAQQLQQKLNAFLIEKITNA